MRRQLLAYVSLCYALLALVASCPPVQFINTSSIKNICCIFSCTFDVDIFSLREFVL